MQDPLNKAQRKASTKLVKVVQQNGLALFWGQIRSGKTRPFLTASIGYRALVVTKKDSIGGIKDEAKEIGIEIDVINYHSIQKMNPDNYDMVILDECHLYIASATPKFKPIWLEVVKFTKDKFLIFASGTPTPETYAGLYTMLALSTWSPFPYDCFTHFFYGYTVWKNPKGKQHNRSWNYDPPSVGYKLIKRVKGYGVPSATWNGEKDVPSYKLTQEEKLIGKIEHLIVNLTRKKTGHKHEAKDVYHNISMTKEQNKLIEKLDKHHIVVKDKIEILSDTPVKMLSKLHQIAGGYAVKGEDELVKNPKWIKGEKKRMKKLDIDKWLAKPTTYYLKKVPPKVDYILKNFDPETTIILSYYKHEQEYLKGLFPHTGSVTKMSTGVDLSHFKTMIIYSMAFSSANYEQVKGRLMNVKRDTPINVHYLISGIDSYVLRAVKSKENFTSRWYKENND